MYAQPIEYLNDNCQGYLSVKTRLYKNYPYNSYLDFREHYLEKKDIQFINDLKDLKKIKASYNLENEILFKHESIQLIVLLKDSITADSYNMDYFYNLPKIEYFGDLFSGQNKLLDSIYIKIGNIKYTLDSHLMTDLLNINSNYYFRSYHPIELFIDKKKNRLCLYISGRIDDLNLLDFSNWGASFVAKYIFDIKSKKWHRIIIPSGYLCSYGYIRCENFWPF